MLSKALTINAGTQQTIEPATSNVEASELIFTPLAGASGSTISIYCQGRLITQIAGPTSATVPGLPFRMERNIQGQKKLRLADWTVDGAHSTDVVQVAWEPCE